jgi:5-methylcytosine-specific restriction protein A
VSSALRRGGSTRKWRRLRDLILIRDRHICGYCGAPATVVDHIISRAECKSRGIYADHPVNLIAACSDCNTSKGASIGDARKKRAGLEGPFFNGGSAGH